MTERAKPHTTIFPLNELYYIAKSEEQRDVKLPIIRLQSRKWQQDTKPTPLPSESWEQYVSVENVSLTIDFNADDPTHAGFDLQKEAIRNQERGLKAVFIDHLVLRVPIKIGEEEHTYYHVDFGLTRLEKDAETLNEIQENILEFKEKYGLYREISKRDKKYFQRLYTRPSCLEIEAVWKIGKPFGSNLTVEMLDGLTDRSKDFQHNLMVATRGIVWTVYKHFTSTGKFVIDGLVERLRQ